MSTPRFQALSVKRVSPEAAGAVAITFAIPESDRERFAFEPGQFLTLRATIDGQDVTVVLSAKEGPRILELWKLRKAKLPVVDLLRQLRQRYAHK